MTPLYQSFCYQFDTRGTILQDYFLGKIDWKKIFYDEILSGEKPYVSNLIATA